MKTAISDFSRGVLAGYAMHEFHGNGPQIDGWLSFLGQKKLTSAESRDVVAALLMVLTSVSEASDDPKEPEGDGTA